MKIYEILFLIRPNMEKEELGNQYKNIENIISKYSGNIESVQDLGRRSLAYEIKKHKEGIYYLMNVKIDPQHLKDLKDELKLSEPILRMVFMKLDEKTLAEKLAAK
ncbi:30S ribosomal protein S6 [bacterium]|nr:MAG: 30S ribosomal protein S6 [bacterium]